VPGASGSDITSAGDWLKRRAAVVRPWLLAGTAAGLVGGIFLILQAWLFAGIVAQAASGETEPALFKPLALLAGIILLRAVAQWLQETAGLEAGLRIRRHLRGELLDQLNRLGPARLADHHSAGIAGQILDHTEALHGYYARFLPQLWLAVLIPLLILAAVFSRDWLAALLLLISAPLIPLFMALIGMGAERLNRDQFATLNRLSGFILDRLRGLATLQLFNHAEHSVDEVKLATEEYRRRSMRTLRVAFLSSAVLEFFSAVAVAALAIYIGFALLGYIGFGPAADMTLFSGLFILLLAPEFFQPLRQLAQHYHDRATALGAADKLWTFLSLPAPAADIHADAQPPETAGVAITLHEVVVSHADRGTVLGPLSLQVEAGERLAVKGPSGAGKTTLLQLIAGFRSPDRGRVLINDHAPAACGGFAWLDQRPFLLHGTLAENLRLAQPDADADSLQTALRQVDLGDWLQRLPAGLDTVITERGVGLSGGQAQRLALARVFLSPAPLVLLDEPTAHLDAHSEQLIRMALKKLSAQDRTLVIATHQPSLLKLARRVVTLENGQLIRDSSHA